MTAMGQLQPPLGHRAGGGNALGADLCASMTKPQDWTHESQSLRVGAVHQRRA
jgi:hypothetical protein